MPLHITVHAKKTGALNKTLAEFIQIVPRLSMLCPEINTQQPYNHTKFDKNSFQQQKTSSFSYF